MREALFCYRGRYHACLARPSRLDNPFVFRSVDRDQLPAKLQLFHQTARGDTFFCIIKAPTALLPLVLRQIYVKRTISFYFSLRRLATRYVPPKLNRITMPVPRGAVAS